jgi:hypothetical protein
MRNLVLMVAGAVGLYEAAKRFGLIKEDKIKDYVNGVLDNLHVKELLNVDKLKEMVGLRTNEPALATA